MTTQFSLRTTVYSTMKISHGVLGFGQNMLNPQINWDDMLQDKQKTIDKYNFEENSKQRDFDYKIGDKVLILNKSNISKQIGSLYLTKRTMRNKNKFTQMVQYPFNVIVIWSDLTFVVYAHFSYNASSTCGGE